jgi:capsular polysaccharide biosynthesis protein
VRLTGSLVLPRDLWSPMTFARYVSAVRAYWRVVTVLTLSGGLVGAAAWWCDDPVYRAHAQVRVSFVTMPGGSPGPDAEQLRRRIIRMYADMAQSARVTQPAVRRLGPQGADPDGDVRALVPLGTDRIDIWVTDDRPDRAANLANAVTGQLAAIVAARSEPAIAAVPRVDVVDPAETPAAPVREWPQLNVLSGLLAGLAAGAGFAAAQTGRGQAR